MAEDGLGVSLYPTPEGYFFRSLALLRHWGDRPEAGSKLRMLKELE